jgi:FMN phosphatase YigB (HAD superfamily)
MRFIYDFDSTLYATGKLWHIWADELQACGLPLTQIEDTMKELSKTGFSCPGHAHMLGITGALQGELLRRYRNRWAVENKTMVFPDVIPFLSNNPHNQLILTFGEIGHQHEKIEMSGLRAHVPDIRLASLENPKRKQLQELVDVSNEPLVFVDDNPRELAAVHEAGLPVELYRMIRPNELIIDPHEGDDRHWRVIRTLDDIRHLL